MKTRASKKLAIGGAMVVATLAMNPAFGDGAKRFKVHFAGGFVQNIQQMQFGPYGPTGVVESRSVALVKGRSTFGKVDIMAISASGPPISGMLCSNGLTKIADIVENNLVLTFGDLSLLYGNGTGVVCPNPANPAVPIAEVEGTWDGGTRRFEHAGGDWSIRFDLAAPVGTATQFIAETGVIKGHLTGLHGED